MNYKTMLHELNEAKTYIQERISTSPEIGIVLGTGLGNLADQVEVSEVIPYTEIPHFPQSTVEGHDGKLVFGTIQGKQVMLMKGRFHYYEGYTMQQVVFPIRVMHLLGAHSLVVSNASGGMNANFEIGDIMVIDDHINLQPDNPLRGPNIDELGPRFPDMSETYYKPWVEWGLEIGTELGLNLKRGVYVSVPGPNFETPAENLFLGRIGGDAVGMSTVPEVLAATHMGMRCFGISVITDLGVDGKIIAVTHEEVQAVAQESEKHVAAVVTRLIGRMESH
jgi:purine-nucleoside phosphorylase